MRRRHCPEALAVVLEVQIERHIVEEHSEGAAAPVEFLEKLAMLIPKPRLNRVVYHGVLAPGAGGRAAVRRAMPASPPSRRT